MRIRSIRPEFWTSEDIAALDWHTRLVFIGLWSYVDDNGVGRDVEKLIQADLFPLEDDPRDTLATVSRALARLSEGGQISRYTVNGKPYLHVTAWNAHQRVDKAAKARYPLPTCENAEPRDTLATPSRDSREISPIGEGEKGRRGEEEKGRSKRTSSSSSETADAALRPEVEALCTRLADAIEANGSKRPTIGKTWRDSTRLMLDRDGRTPDQIAYLIDWSQRDEFWRSNIQSMPKLRDKFDQLRLKAQQQHGPRRVGLESQAAALRFYEETP